MRHILKVVTILDEPFTMIADRYSTGLKEKPCSLGLFCRIPNITANGTVWRSTCCIGHSMDVLQLLAKDIHFIPDLYVVEDGFYGSKINGTWQGMIGDVYKHKADLAMAGLTINNVRSQVVDFSSPYMVVELGIIINTQSNSGNFLNFTFLTYMSENLLWSILGIFLAGIVIVYCFENEQYLFKKTRRRKRQFSYPWKEGFTYFSGLTFQRDLGGKNPQRHGARVTAVVFAFSMVIIMTAYTAVLTASTVKQEERDPFLGMKDDKVSNSRFCARDSFTLYSSFACLFTVAIRIFNAL